MRVQKEIVENCAIDERTELQKMIDEMKKRYSPSFRCSVKKKKARKGMSFRYEKTVLLQLP